MTKLLLLILDRPPILTYDQLGKLSDICINAGTLLFGSFVLPYFLPVDKPPAIVLILGTILGLIFWILAVALVRKN